VYTRADSGSFPGIIERSLGNNDLRGPCEVSRLTAGGGKRTLESGSVSSGETASASCFDEICRGPGDGALGLLPKATPIGQDDSREERGTSKRRAVGAAALVLWEASPLRRRNALHSPPLLWGEASPGERSRA
jgi:hypothetical protein